MRATVAPKELAPSAQIVNEISLPEFNKLQKLGTEIVKNGDGHILRGKKLDSVPNRERNWHK